MNIMSPTETTMATDIELALDKRDLKRRVWRWRIIAAVLGLLALGALASLGARDDDSTGWFGPGPHIARVSIAGMITEDREQLKLLKKLGEDTNVKAVLLAVNSPGGTTTGGEVLYGAIAELAKKKPVVASAGTIATSAAYMISLAADRIFVHGNTITGSVGVIFQYPEVAEALDKIGVKVREIKSGTLKASPSMFAPLDEPGRQLAENLVKEGQVWFQGLVTERRHITPAAIPGLEAGSIYSGRQALAYKLVDQIGTEDDAVTWLEQEKKIAAKLPVLDRKPQRTETFGLLGQAYGGNADSLAAQAEAIVARIIGAGTLTRLRLDGLVSLWHVEAN
jgi:protease IV